MNISSQKTEHEFAITLPFCILFGPWRMNDVSHFGEDGFLLSLLIQMLVSSRNSLIDTPRDNVLPAPWASLSPVELTHKISHHIDLSFSIIHLSLGPKVNCPIFLFFFNHHSNVDSQTRWCFVLYSYHYHFILLFPDLSCLSFILPKFLS